MKKKFIVVFAPKGFSYEKDPNLFLDYNGIWWPGKFGINTGLEAR